MGYNSFVIGLAESIPVIRDQGSALTTYFLDVAGFRAGKCDGGFAVAGFSGAKGFTKASSKS